MGEAQAISCLVRFVLLLLARLTLRGPTSVFLGAGIVKVQADENQGIATYTSEVNGLLKYKNLLTAVVMMPQTTQKILRTEPACLVTWPTKIPPDALVSKGIRT